VTTHPLRLNPGAVIVLEGLDQTGKSTQADRLRKILLPGSAASVHLPTGTTSFSNNVAELLESSSSRPTTALAIQLAHLSSHADTVPQLAQAAAQGSLVLDRWWWSTVAYGWFGGRLAETALSESAFRDLVDAVWNPIRPSIVFVFLHPHHEDPHNSDAVAAGYHALVNEDPQLAVFVPAGTPANTEAFITGELVKRGLARKASEEA
jgi:dTMP kinase